MAGFALFAALPLLFYCAIQTVRDARRRRVAMTVYGAAMLVMLIYLTGRILDSSSY